MKILAFLLACLLINPAYAGKHGLPPSPGQVVMNMYAVGDNVTFPFLNIAKTSAFKSITVSGTNYACNNGPGTANSAWGLYVDANCNYLSGITGATDVFVTLYVAQPTIYQNIAAGFNHAGQSWRCVWDGDAGTASVTGAASSSQSSAQVNWTWPATMDVGLTLHISAFNINNPPNNPRCYLLAYESRVQNGEIFDPDFVQVVISSGSILRFMQWSQVISNVTTRSFADIPTEAYWSWGFDTTAPTIKGGTPLSLMVKLANLTHKGLWFSFPFMYGLSAKSATATAITGSNPAHVTAPGNNFVNGDVIVGYNCFDAASSNIYNGTLFTVANVNSGAGTFDLSGLNSTGKAATSICNFATNFSYANAQTEAANVATYIRDNLDPSLTFYAQYSNEIWNSATLPYSYALNMSLANSLGSNVTGDFSAALMNGIYSILGANGARWKGIIDGCTFCGSGGEITSNFTGANAWIAANSPARALSDLFSYGTISNYFGQPMPGDQTESVTITQATPAVVADVNFNLKEGAPVSFTSTGGGITAGTTYYAVNVGTAGNAAQHFNLSLTSSMQGGGTPLINTSAGLVTPQNMTWLTGTTYINMFAASAAAWRAGTQGSRYSLYDSQINQDIFNGKYTGLNVNTVSALVGATAANKSAANAFGMGIIGYEGGNGEQPLGFCNYQSTTASATFTQASPTVFSVALDLVDNSPVQINTAGGGLSTGTTYYVVDSTYNSGTTTGHLSTTPLQLGKTLVNTSAGLTSPQTLGYLQFNEFWPQGLNTGNDTANYISSLNSFVTSGIPSKYALSNVVACGGGGGWGGIRYVGGGLANDNNPVQNEVIKFNYGH